MVRVCIGRIPSQRCFETPLRYTGRVGRPKVHDEALRGRLLSDAAALVFDGGVDALSLRRLAAGAGTSTTAVYSLFGNKGGLLESLYREAARLFGTRLATVRVTDDPLQDIVRLVDAVRRGQEAGLLEDAPPGRIALSCWGIAHGLVSLELAGTVPSGLDISDDYEAALWAMVQGWSVNRRS